MFETFIRWVKARVFRITCDYCGYADCVFSCDESEAGGFED